MFQRKKIAELLERAHALLNQLLEQHGAGARKLD